MNIVPCSRIGHLFRWSTYSFDGDTEEIKTRNNMRLVEVWMDDLKYLYYAANPRKGFSSQSLKYNSIASLITRLISAENSTNRRSN